MPLSSSGDPGTQKRLAKLQQQSMKQQNPTKTAPRQFVDKKQKINKPQVEIFNTWNLKHRGWNYVVMVFDDISQFPDSKRIFIYRVETLVA